MKSELIKGIARIEKVGSACIGNMAWEAPYIVFHVFPDEHATTFITVKWHSENIPEIIKRLDNLYLNRDLENKWYDFEAFVRGDRVWRMKKLLYR